MNRKLSEFEKKVCGHIEAQGEILTSSLPIRMSGAIPDLKNKRVVEVFKKRTSMWTEKKRKFVKVKRSDNS